MRGMELVLEIPKPQKLVFGPNRSSHYTFTKIYHQISGDEERLYAYIYSGDENRKHEEGYYKLIQVRKLKRVEVTTIDKVEVSKISGLSPSYWTIKDYKERLDD